jgi:hypothetical protein
MKIQNILQRDGGTKVELGGIEYHFEPLNDGCHVAEVEDKAHVDRFLAIPEAYKLYHGELTPKGIPEKIAPTIVQAGDNRLGIATSSTSYLLGSDVHEASYEIGGKMYQLGDVVAKAHTDSGLSVDEWNALEPEDRHAKIDIALDALAEAAEVPEKQPEAGADDRAALVEQYKAKFGSAPHHKASIATIKAKLAE